ncbi:UDP-N-acetylmuramoyl-L-alanyl-D-glutamate--2,6-diaminopimelate ligase [Candidatus Babeliales bacterium]|nr:UDP-N-acetylmuramoyl-L-alanyl-D-glutamate--2,6-diaminopimelate ligase [Candidatus Babeliales bacterium]
MIPKIYPVTCNTENIGPDSTFVAIKGFAQDGGNFIPKAIELGAKKIILSESEKNKNFEQIFNKNKIEFVYVENTRKALAQYSAKALDYPAKKLKFIGITGTKGKTTTSFLIEHILKFSGFKTALLGTVKNKILDQEISSSLTTPNSDYLQMFFAQCVKQKVDYVIMEVSAHALSLDRVEEIEFDIACFTNLAHEHLDFYGDMENYFQAKFSLFNKLKNNASIIINSDDNWGQKAIHNLNILNNLKGKILPFSFKLQQDLHENLQEILEKIIFNFYIQENSISGLKIKIPNLFKQENFELDNIKNSQEIVSSKIFGEFNAYNLAMAFLACHALNLKISDILSAIKNFPETPGRLQMHTLKNKAKAVVDFAHNPSSMMAILQTLRPLTKDLIVVFGCGGDRDKTKRPIMGKIAAQYGDKIIITDDNPRTENRESIIKDILAGIEKKDVSKTHSILDRDKAIIKAVELAGPNSVIAILGKGHENYYLINNQKLHFDDFQEISKY